MSEPPPALRTVEHGHTPPSFPHAMPAPHPEHSPGIRVAVIDLVTAIDAACEACYIGVCQELDDQLRTVPRPKVDITTAADGFRLTSYPLNEGQPNPASRAEQVYGDLIRATAAAIIDQADQADISALAHASWYAAEFTQSAPFPTSIVLDNVVRLVEQDNDVEASMEFAQGLGAVAALSGNDPNVLIIAAVEMAAKLYLAIGSANADDPADSVLLIGTTAEELQNATTPVCPVCSRPPVSVMAAAQQAFCRNDDCPVLTWNPQLTVEEFFATATHATLTRDDEPPAGAPPAP